MPRKIYHIISTNNTL